MTARGILSHPRLASKKPGRTWGTPSNSDPCASGLRHRRRIRCAKGLLDYLHELRRISHLRLADQQVKVLLHDRIPYDHKAIFLPCLFQQAQKKIAAPPRPQPSPPLITTAGDEV